MKKINIINCLPPELEKIFTGLEPDIEDFAKTFRPLETESLYVLIDRKTDAIFIECHILASKLLENSTIDVPLVACSKSNVT
jgi:hypothetical protein